MNAVPKRAPRTVESLEAESQALEQSMVAVRRELSEAKATLPGLIAESDTDGIRQCRESVRRCESTLSRTQADIAELLEAAKAAQQRDQAQANAQAYRKVEQATGMDVQKCGDLADSIVNLGSVLRAAIVSLESTEAKMRRAGVTPDPYVLRARLLGIVQLALHLESDGLLGAAHMLDSRDQLRQNGRADLKKAAREYQILTLQKVRSALHVTPE